MSGIRIAIVAAFVSASLANSCEAQIVRWDGFGGVRIRAPFVAVDVSPYGGTWVRAPFTNVYSYGPAFPYGTFPPFPPVPPMAVVPAIPVPGYRVPGVRVPVVPQVTYVEPSIPIEGYQATRPSLDGHVSEDLRRAASQLQSSLSRRHDGDVWISYLNPGRIIDAIDRGSAPSSLRDLITNYDGVVANASLRPIYTAPGFDDTRELLRVYVDMPVGRQTTVPPSVNSPQPPPANPPRFDEEASVRQTGKPSSDAAPEENLPAPRPNDSQDPAPRPTPPPPAPNPPGGIPDQPTDV